MYNIEDLRPKLEKALAIKNLDHLEQLFSDLDMEKNGSIPQPLLKKLILNQLKEGDVIYQTIIPKTMSLKHEKVDYMSILREIRKWQQQDIIKEIFDHLADNKMGEEIKKEWLEKDKVKMVL